MANPGRTAREREVDFQLTGPGSLLSDWPRVLTLMVITAVALAVILL